MKIFYAVLLLVYLLGLSWYGGSGDPVTHAELESYISAMVSNADARGKDTDKAVNYMREIS